MKYIGHRLDSFDDRAAERVLGLVELLHRGETWSVSAWMPQLWRVPQPSTGQLHLVPDMQRPRQLVMRRAAPIGGREFVLALDAENYLDPQGDDALLLREELPELWNGCHQLVQAARGASLLAEPITVLIREPAQVVAFRAA